MYTDKDTPLWQFTIIRHCCLKYPLRLDARLLRSCTFCSSHKNTDIALSEEQEALWGNDCSVYWNTVIFIKEFVQGFVFGSCMCLPGPVACGPSDGKEVNDVLSDVTGPFHGGLRRGSARKRPVVARVPGSRSKFGNWTSVSSLYMLYNWTSAECDQHQNQNKCPWYLNSFSVHAVCDNCAPIRGRRFFLAFESRTRNNRSSQGLLFWWY